jgi:hypothetical protein
VWNKGRPGGACFGGVGFSEEESTGAVRPGAYIERGCQEMDAKCITRSCLRLGVVSARVHCEKVMT